MDKEKLDHLTSAKTKKIDPRDLLEKFTVAMTQIAEDAKAAADDVQVVLETNRQKKTKQ